MRLQFKTISIRTEEDLKRAERLKSQGWQVGNVGFNTIQFYREKQSHKKFLKG